MAVIFLHSGSMAPEISRVKFAVVMALSMAALVGAAVGAAAQIGSQPATPARGRAAHPFSSTRTPPLVIPEQFAPPQEAYASFSEAGGAAPVPTPPSACQMRLAKIAVFQALGTLVGPGDCGAPDAVQLQAVVLPDQTKVTVTPPATLRCTMAEQVTEWLRDDVAGGKIAERRHGILACRLCRSTRRALHHCGQARRKPQARPNICCARLKYLECDEDRRRGNRLF